MTCTAYFFGKQRRYFLRVAFCSVNELGAVGFLAGRIQQSTGSTNFLRSIAMPELATYYRYILSLG